MKNDLGHSGQKANQTADPSVELLFDRISEQNIFQARYLVKARENWIEDRELKTLELLTGFFIENGWTVEDMVSAYLSLIQSTMAEQIFFKKNHCYSQNNYEKVYSQVYSNKSAMDAYLIGLAVSDCIWVNHVRVLRWYEWSLKQKCTDTVQYYLEVGCGLGINFLHAIQVLKAVRYAAIDISETSVEWCHKLLSYGEKKGLLPHKEYTVMCEDFFKMETSQKADLLTMFEVLEHVPDPGSMLERIKQVTTPDADIYLSTVINSPMLDHIYLFRNVGEVMSMMDKHGLVVEDYFCAAANDVSLEKAEKDDLPISIAMRLKKSNQNETMV